MSLGIPFTRRSFIFSAAALPLAACQRDAALIELTGATMGTGFSVIAVDHDRTVDDAAVQRGIEARLAQVNAVMSNWDAGSEVSRFNAHGGTGPFAVSPELAQLVGLAEEIAGASDGTFDLTLGPVIEAWGFGAGSHVGAAPSETALQAARARAGRTQGLRVDATHLQKSAPETEIFLSGIGKGYGVDAVGGVLRDAGLRDFMVDIGGDLYAEGRNADGAPWRIGIESPDPLSGAAMQVAQISGLGMATSGDYRNYFEVDGTRYSHIIDPETGRPVTHQTASVTVLAQDAMRADAWATAMLALGSERGQVIAEREGLAVFFVDRADGAFRVSASPAFEALQA